MSEARHIGATYRGASLHGQVVQELGGRIAGGHYPPGAVLPNEEDLCVRLGVSRTALREAIKVLAAKGLLESRPRLGTRVREQALWNHLDPDVLAWRCRGVPDAAFLEQLIEIREIVEPAAAQLAARHRTPAQMAEIDAALAAMAAARRIGPWVEADVAFHRAVLGATGNALLMPLAGLIATALDSLLVISARRAESFRVALPDHARVRDAIRSQDTQAAFHAMSFLLADTRRRMLSPPAAARPAPPSRRRAAHRG
jgi:DNA-binding FadR family transcriptional regulator